MLWDEESTYAICVRQMQAVRDAGAHARLSLDLATFSLIAVRCGDFASAAGAIAEADAITEATGSQLAPFSAMMLAALRGREAEARALIESVRKEAIPLGQGAVIQLAEWALAILSNGLGRYQEAVAAAQDASDDGPEELFTSAWRAMELRRSGNQVRQPRGRGQSLSSASLRPPPSLAQTRRWASWLVPVRC